MNRILMTSVIAAMLLGPVALSDTSRFAYATSPISLYPSSGAPGDLISYSMNGATASSAYTLTFDTTTIASGTTDSTGAASGTFTVPAGATAGTHNITFSDGISADQQKMPFQVLSSSSTSSSTVTSSVTIAGTCGLSFDKGSSINYGKLIPGAPSAPQLLILENTGTATATLLAFGSNWLDSSGNNQINVGNTQWSLNSPSPPFTGLTSTPTILTSNFASGNLQTYWQLVANLNNPTFTGTLAQSIGLSVSC